MLALALALGRSLAAPGSGPPWQAMDYGPFLTASIEAPLPKTNLAFKGIALNLGANFGGTRNEAVIFDTDLLRYSAGWTGDFVALKGVVFDGEHWAYPRIAGQQFFGNPAGPGWADAGSFKDPRELPYGPLPRDWAHWKGLYLHEKKVVLSYSVGAMSVLELPALERRGEVTAFARTLNLSPATAENLAQIAHDPARRGGLLDPDELQRVNSATPANRSLVVFAVPDSPAGAPVVPAALAQGLLGRWEFNQAGGNSAADDSGGGRTVQLNDVSWADAGHEQTGLEFDGKHFAEISGAQDFTPLDRDLSFAAWINTSADGTIFALTTPGDQWVHDGRALFLRGGKLTFDIGWVGAVAGSSPLANGQWHHVAMTWSHSDGAVKFFVDGRLDGSGNLKPRRPLANPTARVGFAAPNFPESPWFRGRLDGLRLYGRALTGSEVAALAGQAPRQEILAAALIGGPDTARWVTTDDGNLRLRLPASAEPTRGKILLWSGARESLPEFAALVKASPPPADLEPLTHGGPARWPEKPITHGVLATNDAAYVVDTITEPDPNPWRSWIRFGGLDFFPDGQRAALTTWNGDVWLVSGVDGDLRDLTWQRIATGLFQPLGLKIVENQIYVLGRDQITRLHDLNGDGEADFYENFNNDCLVSEHFHEFALDLKTGPDGSFYYIKCACHGTTAKHPHHGTLMRVSRDGSKLEVVARGFRANNGLGVGPRGELTSIDNQGHWMPGNRVNWIKPGGWYGYQWAWNPEKRETYDEPLCWMHNFVDRSGGTQLWVPTDQWGPFRDDVITISYGMGHIFLLLKEEVAGQMQGAVTRFPLEFETGVMRGAWHPQSGQLYAAGLYGWAGNKTKAGGFYRIRYTGKPVHMAKELHFVRDGIVVGFTEPLDLQSATDPGNYNVTAWNYRWTANYGSPDFKLNGQEGRDTWPVESATVSAARKMVFLKVPDAQRVMQLHVAFKLAFADGAKSENFIHGTIHNLGTKSGADWIGTGAIARADEAKVTLAQEAPGLVQTLVSIANTTSRDLQVTRLAALFVPAGAPPSAYLSSGQFGSRWEGFLKLDLNDEITFVFEGRGNAALALNGQVVLGAHDGKLAGVRSQPVTLRRGLNRFELAYESPPQGDAEFRFLWSSKTVPAEPVPATAFVHDAADPQLRERLLAREGRELFAERQCAKCHQPASPWAVSSMPELAADAPAFDGLGSRLKAPWIGQWLLDPKAIRPDALMPKLLSGPQSAKDASDIAAHLANARDATPPIAPAREAATNLVAAGTKLFADLGCAACHLLPGELTLTNDTRVPLNHVAAKWEPAALDAFLRAPTNHFRWTRMPDFKLTADEAAGLAAFVLERAKTDPRWAAPTNQAPGDAKRGGELVASLGCLNCHTLDKAQNQFQASTLATLARGDWTRGCVADKEASRGKAPDFALADSERSALRAFAKQDFPATLTRDCAAEFATRQYAALRCNACHPRDTETDLLTRLAAAAPKPKNAYDDEEGGGGGGSVHVGRPLLTYAGEKLYAGWMQRFLDGTLPYKPRPELQGRMPAFPAYAAGLAAGIAEQHGYPAESAPAPQVDAQLADIGRRLTLVEGGFSCIACHNVGAQKALAGKDTATVNFTCVAERLRPTYYWRYVQDPTRLVPSTMMPKFIGDDGTTPIKTVLNGDPQKQFTAIWHYLMSLRTEVPAK
jgi:mono/diheme cytochrome c family protein